MSFLPLEYKTLKIFRKVSLMIKTTISLLIGASLTLLAPQLVYARGCGGARTGGGSYSGSRS